MVAVHLYKPELKQLPALTCYFLTSMKSSSASLVGLNEKPDRWISCLLLLFSLHCSEETCGHLFLLEICTSSFFNSCSITERRQRQSLSVQRSTFQSLFLQLLLEPPPNYLVVLPLEYRTPQNKLVRCCYQVHKRNKWES